MAASGRATLISLKVDNTFLGEATANAQRTRENVSSRYREGNESAVPDLSSKRMTLTAPLFRFAESLAVAILHSRSACACVRIAAIS